MMDRRIISFLLLAYSISWSIVGVGMGMGLTSVEHWAYPVMAALVMFGPAIAALVQHRLIDKAPWAELGLRLKGTRWGVLGGTAVAGMTIVPVFLLVVWLGGEVLGIAAFGEVSVTGARFSRYMDDLLANAAMSNSNAQVEFLRALPGWAVLGVMLLVGLLAAFTVNLPFMLGEELGWRGYLWLRLREWPEGRRVLFTGLVWGLWHAPLIVMGHNYPGQPVAGIAMMVLFCLAAGWLFDLTRTYSGSIWSACVLHGLINGTAGAAAIFAWNGDVLVAGIAGLAGVIALLVLALAFRATVRRPAQSVGPV